MPEVHDLGDPSHEHGNRTSDEPHAPLVRPPEVSSHGNCSDTHHLCETDLPHGTVPEHAGGDQYRSSGPADEQVRLLVAAFEGESHDDTVKQCPHDP